MVVPEGLRCVPPGRCGADDGERPPFSMMSSGSRVTEGLVRLARSKWGTFGTKRKRQT